MTIMAKSLSAARQLSRHIATSFQRIIIQRTMPAGSPPDLPRHHHTRPAHIGAIRSPRMTSSIGSTMPTGVAHKQPWTAGTPSVHIRSASSDRWGEGEAEAEHRERPVTPWVRSVASGVDLLRNPKYNKGLAFTEEERGLHYLRGLLPPGFSTQEMQVQRVLSNLRDYGSSLQKYVHLMALQERNERLFYRVLIDHIEELMPVVYTPTAGLVCQQYGLMFRRPRGLFISSHDRGRVMSILKNWPERSVRAIVVTDGERVLGRGDLGVQGMGIPVGKLALYVACGGVHPAECLPVSIDVGTNNEELLNDPFYPGLRQRRLTGEAYDDLIDEFMEAVKERYGNVLVQYEAFSSANARRFLFQYRGTHLVFNDGIQGTAAVCLAGLMAAVRRVGGPLGSHTFLFTGATEAGTVIAELLAMAIGREGKLSTEEARKKIWLLDGKGLVVRERLEQLEGHTVEFAHPHPPAADLLAAVQSLRPSILIGCSGEAGSFSEAVCESMAQLNEQPVIFALSSPASRSECTAEEAYRWTKGSCIFASGAPFEAVEVGGKRLQPGQAATAYIFPGVGLGLLMSATTRIRDEMFLAAAEALAAQVTDEDLASGTVFPPISKIRTISAHIAKAVASKAYESGLASRLPKPPDLLSYAQSYMYDPHYRQLR